MSKPRPFEATQLRTRFRGWQLIATSRAVTIIRGNKHFEFDHLASFDAAIRKGKLEINRLEGPQVWDQNYTNEALR